MNGLTHFEFRLADRYLAEECTPEEAARVAQLIEEHAEGWPTIVELHAAFALQLAQAAPPADAARERLGVRIAMVDALSVADTEVVGRNGHFRPIPEWVPGARRNNAFRLGLHPARSFRTWYSLAGIALAGVVLALGWGTSRQIHIPMLVYATGNGQRANITLSDGTTVSLNVASRLEVPADYLTGDHALRLNGEALFTVLHHDRKPLTVTAGEATTRVLGTSFAVRHYATDTTTTVAVRDGRVMVWDQVVSAAQQVEVGPAGFGHIGQADPARFSFASGVLSFNSVPLAAAIVDLNRWYDADIRLGDPLLAARRLTGEYIAGSVADLSNILELTFNVRAVRDGRVLTLYVR